MKLSFLPALFLCLASYAQQRPNVLVIFTDDHTQQTISAYGSRYASTPNIDRIAREGALLKNSFVTNSICAPSRAVFLTGNYSHINGLRDNGPTRSFNGDQQQLQKVFGANGYQTAWIGKWHLQSLPKGFDFWTILPDQGHYFEPDLINMKNDTGRVSGYVTNVITDLSLQWLKNRDVSKPFFLVVGQKATHRNWMPDLEDLAAYDDVEFPIPYSFNDNYSNRQAAEQQDMSIEKTMLLHDDLKVNVDYDKPPFNRMTAAQKKAYADYYGKVSAAYEKIKDDPAALRNWKFQRYMKDYLATAKGLDRNVGRILDELDKMGLKQNTIVVYTSDQGFYMGEHGWFDKRFMYEESLRTPFMIRYPGRIKPGSKLTGMVVNIDYAPTLLELAGVKTNATWQGESFAAALSGGSGLGRDAMYYHYYEYPEPHRVAKHFGVRTERFKLIRFYHPMKTWELYDLQKDRYEMENVYSDPAYRDIVVGLKQKLQQLITRYKDDEALKLMEP